MMGSLMLAMAMVMLVSVSSALAAPAWRVESGADTVAAPGGTLQYYVNVANVGSDATDGVTPYTLVVTLPSGMSGVDASGGDWNCPGASGVSVITCTNADQVIPRKAVNLIVTVAVDPSASGTLTTSFDVSGGGATGSATTVDPTRIDSTAPGFGIDAFDTQVAADAAGTPFTQAGGHPYDASATIDFNRITSAGLLNGPLWPVEPVKDVLADLPPGLIGNPTATEARCTAGELAHSEGLEAKPLCPTDSQVGTATIRYNGGFASIAPKMTAVPIPVFNLTPPADVPARFGFNFLGTVVTLNGELRSGSDYGLSVNTHDSPEALPVAGVTVTFWGVPADPSHDAERACPGELAPWDPDGPGPTCTTSAPPRAFLRIPTSCTPPGTGLTTTIHVDSWLHPGVFDSAQAVSHNPPMYPYPPDQWGAPQGPTGCAAVPFDPTVSASPATLKTVEPSGFSFDLSLPQNDDPTAIGEADLRKAVVTLPAGVRVSPSSADGLGACSPAEIDLHSAAEPTCPDSSKIGSLTVDTPLLDDPLQGGVYLATPHDNPFDSLLAVYLVVRGPGIVVKLPGKVEANAVTGQLTATFDDNPQLPFSNLHLQLKDGPRAPLATAATCGTYSTESVLTSWSGATVASSSSFTLSGDGNGGPCAVQGFSPTFSAGGDNPVAGGFTPFTLRLSRSDQDSEFGSLSSLSSPPGLLADVGSISTRCSDAQAIAASCPAASHVGEVTAGAGAGSNPFYVGGDVYFTGPYKGDPFGLAIIVHALAGPFDLGYVVGRAAIRVNSDGSIITRSDPFPTILQGIPLQVRDIRVSLDRPGFVFNPTSCAPMSVNGTVLSTDNQRAGVSSRFQVGECSRLRFAPKFSVSTSGKTSKAGGASLRVHLATDQGPSSNPSVPAEADLSKVEVQLPAVLPAKLSTLQKACTSAQFARDPAACPSGSFVGSATAHTPLFANPLSGPAILVSHGGVAFPDLVLVLQGEGIRLDVTGHTQIKNGVTFSRFQTVPDAPVSSFDLNLPQGSHAVLATNASLCANTKTVTTHRRVTRRVKGHARKVTVKVKRTVASPLLMPTTMTAQNGAVIHQTTKIAVTGCPSAKAAKHAKKARRSSAPARRAARRH